jgi:hypothetical protein
MRQRDTSQKDFSKSGHSRKQTLVTPALSRDEDVKRTQRVAVPQVASGREHSARRMLLRQLGGRRTLRQAILLSEILGPPMALYDESKDLVNQKW